MRYTGSFWIKVPIPHYSIANSMPKNISMETIHELVPPWDLVVAYKRKDINEDEYSAIYTEQLEELGIDAILGLVPDNTVVCCWEKTGFCHRHVLAEYLGDRLMREIA